MFLFCGYYLFFKIIKRKKDVKQIWLAPPYLVVVHLGAANECV